MIEIKLYFVNSKGNRRQIADVNNQDEVSGIIKQFLEERNYKSYYTRSYRLDNIIVYDVGSWSEQFELELEVENE